MKSPNTFPVATWRFAGKRWRQSIDGFDPIFRAAGDDVDLCWRLQNKGYKIGFSPAAVVWHFRRNTLRDYLKQQRGYGKAETLLFFQASMPL
jgi:O-antigen biosynthesis protein